MEHLSVLNNLLIVIASLVVSFLALHTGSVFLKFFDRDGSGKIDSSIYFPLYSIVTGYGVIVFVMYFLSYLGVLSRASIGLFLLMQFVLFILFCRSSMSVFRNFILKASDYWASLRGLDKGIFSITAFILAYYFIVGLLLSSCPSLDADTATNYLNAAKLFLQYHRLIDVGNAVGDMGKNGFMIIAYGMGIHSALLAHLQLFILTFIGITWFYFFLLRRSDVCVASIVIVAFITMTHQWEYVFLPVKFDGVTFTFSAVALVSLWRLMSGNWSLSELVANGISVGVLGGLSYNNLVATSFFMVMVMGFLIVQRIGLRDRFILLLIWGGAFLAVFMPGYAFNWMVFKNPVYPFGGTIFGAGYGYNIPEDTYAYQYYKEITSGFAAHDIAGIFSLPFVYLQAPGKLQAGKDFIFAVMWAVAHLFLPGYLFYAALKYIRTKSLEMRNVLYLGAGFVLIYLVWASSQHILRYLMSGFPFLLLLISLELLFLYDAIKCYEVIIKRSVVVFILGVFLYNFFPLFNYVKVAVQDIVLNRSIDSIVSERLLYQTSVGYSAFGRAMVEIKKILKPNDKVLSFITGNYYFGDKAIVFSGNGAISFASQHSFSKPLSQYESAAEYVKDLKNNGFSYIVLNPNFLYCTKAEDRIIKSLLSTRFPDRIVENVIVYRLN